VDRNTALWALTLFFGASVLFGLVRRATEDSSTAVTVGAQLVALVVLVAAIVVFVRRSQR
jgi:lipopolysaccharide export LptBFGC system permease protein LptF